MILEKLAEASRYRVEKRKVRKSPELLRREAESMERDTGFPFEAALRKPELSFICEVKKASPSKGVLAPEFPYLQIASEYEEAGADAVSCLTEPEYFQGSDRYLKEIAGKSSIPVLRKDFTVDPYMIYEAKVLGASAVLLICALLDRGEIREGIQIADSLGMSALVEAHDEEEGKSSIPVLRKDFTVDPYMIYEAKVLGASAVLLICALLDRGEIREGIQIADSLGMSALVEAHDEEEVEKALDAGARIIGVNNRDLRTFQVNLDNSRRLRRLVPSEILFVSESGIRTSEDIRRLRENGTDAVLIGETLMKRPDKKKALRELKEYKEKDAEKQIWKKIESR